MRECLNRLARAQCYLGCAAAHKGPRVLGWRCQICLALRASIPSQAALAAETNWFRSTSSAGFATAVSRREHPAHAAEYSHKIGRAIRCKSLQALQQRRDGHEGSSDYEGPGPGETDNRCDCEITDDVVDLPTKPRTGRPISRTQRDDHEHDYGGHAEKFCHEFDCHSVRSIVSGCR